MQGLTRVKEDHLVPPPALHCHTAAHSYESGHRGNAIPPWSILLDSYSTMI